jgi:hypothetical protein
MQVEERRFRNLLPLAHILFVAKKPVVEGATEERVTEESAGEVAAL